MFHCVGFCSPTETANEIARKNWRSVASKALAREEEIVPTLVKHNLGNKELFSKGDAQLRRTGSKIQIPVTELPCAHILCKRTKTVKLFTS